MAQRGFYEQLLENSNNENDNNWMNGLELNEANLQALNMRSNLQKDRNRLKEQIETGGGLTQNRLRKVNLRSNLQKDRNRLKEQIETGGGLTQNRLRKKQDLSPLKVSLFNVTGDGNKATGTDLYNMAKGFTDFSKRVVDGGRYTMKVVKVRGVLQGFVSAFEITSEYGFIEKHKTKNLTGMDFVINVTDRSGTVTKTTNATLFRTGKFRMSGGYVYGSPSDANINGQPEETRQFMRRLGIDGGVRSLKINNISGIFKYKYRVVADENIRPLGQGYSVTKEYEPEISAGMKFDVKKPDPKFVMMVFVSSKHIGEIMGVKSAAQLRSAFEVAKHIFKVGIPIAPRAEAKSLNLSNLNHQTRVTNRLNEMPAPELVKRRGTTCPKPRRPDPLSFQGKCSQGDSYYVKPNPQGQPCCYKKPKTTNFSKKKVAEAYKKANVKVPQGVRNFFGVAAAAAANNKKNNVAMTRLTKNTIQTFNDPIVGFKIGTRQCSRYSKEALIDIAKRLAIPDITSGLTKTKLCEKIKAKTSAIGANRTNNAVNGNTVVQFTNNNGVKKEVTGNSMNKVKIGRRFCKTYLKKDLLRFALKLRIVGVSDSLKKDEICSKIYEHAAAVRSRKAVVRNQRVVNEARVAEQRKANAEARRVAEAKAKKNKEVANRERAEEAKNNAEWTRLGLDANNLGVYFQRFNTDFNGNDVRSLINQTYAGLRNLPTSSRSRFPRLSDIQKLKKQIANALSNKKVNNFARELEVQMRRNAPPRPVVAPAQPAAARRNPFLNLNVEEI